MPKKTLLNHAVNFVKDGLCEFLNNILYYLTIVMVLITKLVLCGELIGEGRAYVKGLVLQYTIRSEAKDKWS